MQMNDKAMKALLDAFDASDWQEMTIKVGTDSLHVSRTAGSAPAVAPASDPPAAPSAPHDPAPVADAPTATPLVDPTPSPPTPALPSAPAAGGAPPAAASPSGGDAGTPSGTVVESPSVGLFWRAPSPGAPPFVEEGGRVAAGDTVAIVEVMKLMNHVVAPVDGVVTAVLVENGATVEYGQPLLSIDPEG